MIHYQFTNSAEPNEFLGKELESTSSQESLLAFRLHPKEEEFILRRSIWPDNVLLKGK